MIWVEAITPITHTLSFEESHESDQDTLRFGTISPNAEIQYRKQLGVCEALQSSA